MSMWKCNECEAVFEEPRTIDDPEAGPYKVCPECEDEDIIRTVPCKQCSDQNRTIWKTTVTTARTIHTKMLAIYSISPY